MTLKTKCSVRPRLLDPGQNCNKRLKCSLSEFEKWGMRSIKETVHMNHPLHAAHRHFTNMKWDVCWGLLTPGKLQVRKEYLWKYSKPVLISRPGFTSIFDISVTVHHPFLPEICHHNLCPQGVRNWQPDRTYAWDHKVLQEADGKPQQEYLGPSWTPGETLFVGQSSVFNTITPDILNDKLTHLGPFTSICRWLKDFSPDRQQTVRLVLHLSPTVSLNTGSPYGCMPSPLLYSVYI